MSAVMSSSACESARIPESTVLHRRPRSRDLPPRAADERRELSHAHARARVRRSFRLREVDVPDLRRMARVALRHLAVGGAREGAHGARAAHCCRRSRRRSRTGGCRTTKVRALTRVAHEHDEDLLLAYALRGDGGASRGALPADSQRFTGIGARRAARVGAPWSLTVWRDEARGTLRLTVELPIEEGEVIARALDCAVAAGEVATGVEPDAIASPRKGTAWRAQQADALVAIAKAYLDGGGAGERSGAARRITIKSSCMSTKNPSAEGLGGRICRSTRSSACVRRQRRHGRRRRRRHAARRRAQAADGIDAAEARAVRRAIAAARSRAAIASTTSTRITCSIGRTAATRASRT